MQIEKGPLVLLLDKQIGRKSQMKVVISLRGPSIAPSISDMIVSWDSQPFKVSTRPPLFIIWEGGLRMCQTINNGKNSLDTGLDPAMCIES